MRNRQTRINGGLPSKRVGCKPHLVIHLRQWQRGAGRPLYFEVRIG
jgi:hypothetical protein